jgi:Flp pilus assembly pilin Flp
MFNHALAYVMSVLVADRKSEHNEKGASAVEYALVVGAVALVVVGALKLLGGKITTYIGGLTIG